MQKIVIEINVGNGWEDAAEITVVGSTKIGFKASTSFEYLAIYASKYIEKIGTSGSHAVGCQFPLSFVQENLEACPAFLLDLYPQGNALKYVVEKLGLRDIPSNEWKILTTANISPPGNIRIKGENRKPIEPDQHKGFNKAEVIAKGIKFLEYLKDNGAPVSGTTGAAGAAPKFMLNEDTSGLFHAPDAISNKNVKNYWLIKYPRGEAKKRDRDILENEKLYYDLAKKFGLYVGETLYWEGDCLFIPRFDRNIKSNRTVEHIGLESFYSLANISAFGSFHQHETFIKILHNFSSSPEEDILEYIARDILFVMTGNTDNHGRNSSVLKTGDNIKISPLYDFAPMKFDPEGIIRATEWKHGLNSGLISYVSDFLSENSYVPQENFKAYIEELLPKCKVVEAQMIDLGISNEFIQGTKAERSLIISELNAFLGKS
jgi:serine/threonine-protein kinase HipA